MFLVRLCGKDVGQRQGSRGGLTDAAGPPRSRRKARETGQLGVLGARHLLTLLRGLQLLGALRPLCTGLLRQQSAFLGSFPGSLFLPLTKTSSCIFFTALLFLCPRLLSQVVGRWPAKP